MDEPDGRGPLRVNEDENDLTAGTAEEEGLLHFTTPQEGMIGAIELLGVCLFALGAPRIRGRAERELVWSRPPKAKRKRGK